MVNYIKERNGSRMFEKISGWNTIDYTIISDRNRLAKYADNAGSKTEKLTLTFFRIRKQVHPLPKYGKLVTPIQLEDFSILTRQDIEDGNYFLELNADKEKARLWKMV